ncbi:MAG: ATP phosphoribosyltransferase [Oscillospiraceae bacterium]|nr:ATP phosphoribosyltransferase [Oscillospiraceae bacterium]
MDFSIDVLRSGEQATMRLRALYRQFGYSEYRMSRFEEYELYADNKAFLKSGDIITFTGAGGKLMALRPDVTLSIVKSTKDGGGLQKLYYNENVYRPDGFEFKEQMQVGLECIGEIDTAIMGEVLLLAQRSLAILGEPIKLYVSHMGFISGLLNTEDLTSEQTGEVLLRVSEKNISELKRICSGYGLNEGFIQSITTLTGLHGSYEEVAGQLRSMSVNAAMDSAIEELEQLSGVLSKLGALMKLNLDFSIVNDLSYYSGIIFQGYVRGIPTKILSGGRYDKLLRKFGKRSGAIGFAVYLDLLERQAAATDQMLNIALPKGRLGEAAYGVFEKAGYGCPAIYEESRKLVFESPEHGVRYFWVKPSDVPIYVERGAADIGVAGKDILLEHSPDVYELLDLGLGKCRMCVAAEKTFSPENLGRTLRVATKFPNIARSYYDRQGHGIDIISLNGSIELAPLLGLSDVIVDIVESGKTLLENDLEPVETIVDISARLIANKASYKFSHGAVSKLCREIAKLL